MKRVVKVKLSPSPAQVALLDRTLRVCNEAANLVSRVARERSITSKFDLQKVTYSDVKQVLGSAQPAVRTIAKVADAYKTHRANLRAGNYGKKDSPRRLKAEAKVIEFRPLSSQPFDDRILSWKHEQQMVSIWVVDAGLGKPGRILVPFVGNPAHLNVLAHYRKGETDLVYADGKWFLHATIDQPAPAVQDPDGFIGVDMGIVTIAATATDDGTPGTDWSGGAVTAVRKKKARMRRRLQTKGTKSAKRVLKTQARKEARFATDVNHQVSKTIVAEAKRTGRGIAVEDLNGIRERVRHRKPQRATFHSWAFHQLGQFLTYKAQAAGVQLVVVDPAYTSQTCSGCGHVDRKNRVTQALFVCRQCGVSLNADTNAAINIARRGTVVGRAEVNQPNAAQPSPVGAASPVRKGGVVDE